ncbi:Tad domain-containing protein [Sulfitobacter sp. D35]|uniref:Tad domain-containing protein n=1 Tax=Sulfitobacter sp. D35 TaxID=3083252 RepID=UPI00296EC7AA|nr:Tad domain-containing protein [Sulfitobacter sp. D35]MDW4497021.1 Tad domain-containing protein [Sulfitobacter sp. D35]
MTIFALFIILMMVLVAGIGVDLMHNEMDRTRLQNTMDRAVLAAADLDQQLDPKAVVEDYFDKAGLREYLTSVVPDAGLNYRSVTATARMDTRTQFMHRLGLDTLPVPAASAAVERVPNVEISLVLDISGSMRYNSRMDNLRPAAKNFVKIVLEGSAIDHTSINIIPYAGQTNPGPFMFNRLGGVRYAAMALDEDDGGVDEQFNHTQLPPWKSAGDGKDKDDTRRFVYPNNSSCFELNTSDFNTATLPAAGTYAQVPLFMNWTIASAVMDWGWCPQDRSSIRYASNKAGNLDDLITTMRMHDGTGTHYAMKWALALLNPASQPHFAAMADAGLIPNEFRNRPAGYRDDETVKYIVLMTDGQITEQVRPKDEMHILNPTVELDQKSRKDKGHREQLTSASTNVSSFKKQCDLAKATDRPIVVYTIAFEAPGTPEQQMRDCASTPSHFFTAQGSQINEVFSTIARQINQLRLTQ